MDEMYPGDGLKEFAIWCDWNYEADRTQVHKIEPYDPDKKYPKEMRGIVRAKDELDAWRVVTRDVRR